MKQRNGFYSATGTSKKTAGGFTVVELLVTLVVAAIALALAAPSLQTFTANNQLISANNTIVAGMNMARYTAITTGDDITICSSADGVSCSNDNWDQGWIVFNDQDGDSAADDAEIIRVVNIEASVAGSGFGQAIVFEPDGTTTMGNAATITNCYAYEGVTDKCLAVIVNPFGMITSAETYAMVEETGPTSPGYGEQ